MNDNSLDYDMYLECNVNGDFDPSYLGTCSFPPKTVTAIVISDIDYVGSLPPPTNPGTGSN